jgi:hypothetical protein
MAIQSTNLNNYFKTIIIAKTTRLRETKKQQEILRKQQEILKEQNNIKIENDRQ